MVRDKWEPSFDEDELVDLVLRVASGKIGRVARFLGSQSLR